MSLYDVSVPAFIRGFSNLTEILKKGEAFANEQGISHEDLLRARLFDDMLPLTGQVQRASDTSKYVPVRVGKIENVSMADEEASFAELYARIDRTMVFLKAVDPSSMEGRDDAEVVLTTRGGSTTFTARTYVLEFALPNFYFHVTTAYGILRHKGVPVGKLDYLGRS
jgi:hypothetical protein